MARNPFRRAAKLSPTVLASLGLARGERPLAATEARDGTWLVGTRDTFIIAPQVSDEPAVPPADPGETTRIPWQLVERADWDRDEERLQVSEVGQFGLVRPSYEFGIEDPGLLLELVRERVTASVVLQRRVAVNGQQGLLVVGRRAPSGDGEITWAYEFDRGVDPDDPRVIAAAERGLRAATEELGL